MQEDDMQMDANLTHLIERLAAKPPVDEISDADIQAEVAAVRTESNEVTP